MKQFRIIVVLVLCLFLSACSFLQKETEASAESPVIPLEEQSEPEQINNVPVFDLSEEDDPSFSGELADPDPAYPEQSEATEAIDDLIAQLEEDETADTDIEDSLKDTTADSEASVMTDEGAVGPEGETTVEPVEELLKEEPVEEPADEVPVGESVAAPVGELPEEEPVHELPNTGIFLEDD